MILKILHSSFEIDLSSYKVSISEENHWFSDRYLSKFVIPITVELSDDLAAKLGDILSYNSKSRKTYLEVYFFHNGNEHEAIMEVEELVGREATINVRFGFEEVPNYDKPLKDLPLQEVELSEETIYEHATTKIGQTWPTTNYNFVQVHCNQFDVESEKWKHYEGLINKRVGSNWTENEYDEIEDEQVNRNIMQPQPYLMHVLETGFSDAGFTMAGDFMLDNKFRKALMSEISEYYSTINIESEEFTLTMDEFDSTFNFDEGFYGLYDKRTNLSEFGRYKIAGNLTIRKYYGYGEVKIYVDGVLKYNWGIDFGERGTFTRQVDFNFNYFSGAGEIKVTSINLAGFEWEGITYNESLIADLTISQLAKYDGSGNLLPTLLAPEKIVLKECVPDMTFGELLTILKNWKNLDLQFIGQTVYLQFIDSQLPVVDAIDLSDFEIEKPRRIFSKGDTYLLKFQDLSSEEYTFDSIFIKQGELFINDYTTNDDTTEIIINSVPLPIATKKNITTADHFLDDKSRLKLIVFDGSTASNNLAEDVEELLIPSVYVNHFENWLNLRLNAQGFSWSFIMTDEQLRKIGIRNKVFAYKNNHVIKNINKDLVSRGIWNVELETLTIE